MPWHALFFQSLQAVLVAGFITCPFITPCPFITLHYLSLH